MAFKNVFINVLWWLTFKKPLLDNLTEVYEISLLGPNFFLDKHFKECFWRKSSKDFYVFWFEVA